MPIQEEKGPIYRPRLGALWSYEEPSRIAKDTQTQEISRMTTMTSKDTYTWETSRITIRTLKGNIQYNKDSYTWEISR